MSADDNAPKQAREVEVVARAMLSAIGYPADENINENDLVAVRACLAALAPLRAAERQEAARAALIGAADLLRFEADCVDWVFFKESLGEVEAKIRDRADGVTGRSGT